MKHVLFLALFMISTVAHAEPAVSKKFYEHLRNQSQYFRGLQHSVEMYAFLNGNEFYAEIGDPNLAILAAVRENKPGPDDQDMHFMIKRYCSQIGALSEQILRAGTTDTTDLGDHGMWNYGLVKYTSEFSKKCSDTIAPGNREEFLVLVDSYTAQVDKVVRAQFSVNQDGEYGKLPALTGDSDKTK